MMDTPQLTFPGKGIDPCRVFCIGRNYGDHIAEMGYPPDDACVVFMKPATSLVPPGRPIRLPRSAGVVHHELEMVVAIGTDLGEDEDSLLSVAGLSLGLDLTLREIQKRLKSGGHPWELSKAFEQSAPIGLFVPVGGHIHPDRIEMSCKVNEETRQHGHTRDMLFPVQRLIEILRRTWRLRRGDVIFTGTPAGVGPVAPGDTITIESPQIGTFSWDFR